LRAADCCPAFGISQPLIRNKVKSLRKNRQNPEKYFQIAPEQGLEAQIRRLANNKLYIYRKLRFSKRRILLS